jgi:hypothetical protein
MPPLSLKRKVETNSEPKDVDEEIKALEASMRRAHEATEDENLTAMSLGRHVHSRDSN